MLTPDSSRFWPAEKYEVGRSQESYDKVCCNMYMNAMKDDNANDRQQYLRDWLTESGFKGNEGVEMPEDVVTETANKYREAYEKLTGKQWS